VTVSHKTRLHFILTDDRGPEGKLADVEIRFSEGLLAGMKITGVSVWEPRGEGPLTVHLPAKTYQGGGGGTMYYHFLRPHHDDDEGRAAQERFREEIRTEYLRVMETAEKNGR